jgi:molecular chaperone DnaK (HSP70)
VVEVKASHGDTHLGGDDFDRLLMDYADYEQMIRPLLDKTLDSVHRCFKDAAMLPGAVDKVVLVGWASRTPLVSELLGNAIRTETHQEIDPDLIVAMGATIQERNNLFPQSKCGVCTIFKLYIGQYPVFFGSSL